MRRIRRIPGLDRRRRVKSPHMRDEGEPDFVPADLGQRVRVVTGAQEGEPQAVLEGLVAWGKLRSSASIETRAFEQAKARILDGKFTLTDTDFSI